MILLILTFLLGLSSIAPAAEPSPLATALAAKSVTLEASGNGRDTILLKFAAPAKASVSMPAGTQFIAESGETQIALRSVPAEIGPASELDAIVPAAALSTKNTGTQRSLRITDRVEPKLTKLLELIGQHNDLPRPTAQLAIFILLEDATWPAWKTWLAPKWAAEKPAQAHPTPAEVAQAVDGIAFARLAAPAQKFTILADEDFKRLALRNPWARGKAMALYGLSVEDAITGDSSLPVDLGKLLHTSPNDNCAICQQRNKGPAEIP